MRIEVALIKVPWQPCSLHLLLQTHRSSWGHETNLHLRMGEKEKANKSSLCACAYNKMSVALPAHPHPIRAPNCACADTTVPLHLRPLSSALSSTLALPGRAKPEEPPDFSSLAQWGLGSCCGYWCCCGASSAFPPPARCGGRVVLGDVGSGLLPGWRGEHPFHAPQPTAAKPSVASKMRISCLFPSTVCGDPLPFHHRSREKSSESNLHTRRPRVGGFIHFWWVFKYICFGGREKVKKR